MFVSRSVINDNTISYSSITKDIIQSYHIIINCTPLGTFPNIKSCPEIPYEHLTEKHLLYDLVYNPAETEFLKQGLKKGTTICNGERMLELQAEKAWRIWN